MKNKKTIIVLVFIFLFSLSFRLPIDDNFPHNPDTYTISKLANDIKEKEYIQWIKNPLSLTGFYPLSYQTGGIILLANMSILFNLDVFDTILVWNVFLLLAITIIFFLISKELFHDEFVALLSTLIYLNTRVLFYFTEWFYSVRNVFLLFYLFLLWLLLSKNFKGKNIIYLFILGIMAIIHKLIIIIPILLIAFFASKIMQKKITGYRITSWIIFGMTLLLFSLSVIIGPILKLGPIYESPLQTGIRQLDQFIQTGFSYGMDIGIPILLFPMGYLALVIKKKKTQNEFFLLFFILLFSPILKETTYISYIVMPIIILITAFFFKKFFLTSKFNKSRIKAMIFGILILAIISPLFIEISKIESDWGIARPETHLLMNHLNGKNMNEGIVCNMHNVYCNQITALSNNRVKSLSTSSELMTANKINLTNPEIKIKLKKLYSAKESVLNHNYFSDIYEGFLIIYPNVNPDILEKIIEFTNVKYIIDSINEDSLQNSANIEDKFGLLNQVYDNGLQQIKPIRGINYELRE